MARLAILRTLPGAVLGAAADDFANPSGPDLLARTAAFGAWRDTRLQAGLWWVSCSLDTLPGPKATVRNETGMAVHGVNFASQDALSLSAHPAVHEAARSALRDFGPHSAGTPCSIGNTALSLALEAALAELLEMEHVLLFPTGWAAAFGTIVGLVRPTDHVVIDERASASLQQGARAATPAIHRAPRLDTAACRTMLAAIRARDTTRGILVVTEGTYAADADAPDLRALQDVCREHGAVLLVDVSHDLGVSGPSGTGVLGVQGVLGSVDLVVGSFSKALASNGGFVATRSSSVKQFVKLHGATHADSSALSPLQAGIAVEAVRIVRSWEGQRLRADLLHAVAALRDALAIRELRCLGGRVASVPVPIGDRALVRLTHALLHERGVFVDAEEHAPAGADVTIRLHVTAAHRREHVQQAAEGLATAVAQARATLAQIPGRSSSR